MPFILIPAKYFIKRGLRPFTVYNNLCAVPPSRPMRVVLNDPPCILNESSSAPIYLLPSELPASCMKILEKHPFLCEKLINKLNDADRSR